MAQMSMCTIKWITHSDKPMELSATADSTVPLSYMEQFTVFKLIGFAQLHYFGLHSTLITPLLCKVIRKQQAVVSI